MSRWTDDRLSSAEHPDWCPDCGTAPCTHPMPAGTWTGYAAAVGLTFILTLLVFLAGDLLARTWT